MSRSLAALLTLSLLACGGESTTEPPPPLTGPIALAIVSGQNQTGHAGDTSLAKPVDVAIMRTPSGRLVMRVVGNGPTAQTTVNGSPVPGAVVCNHVPDSGPALIPWTDCTNSDSTGHALMFYGMPTETGVALGVIRGTYQNEPVVFDTAKATVLPGPAADMWMKPYSYSRSSTGAQTGGIPLAQGDSLDVRVWIDSIADQYGNRITDYTLESSIGSDDPRVEPSAWHASPYVVFPDTGYWRAAARVVGGGPYAQNAVYVHVTATP